MFLSIYHNQSGQEFLRRLSPTESLNLRAHVEAWARQEFDCMAKPSFSEPGAHIANGCGDYQAEIRHTKQPGASCWTSESFFMEWIGE